MTPVEAAEHVRSWIQQPATQILNAESDHIENVLQLLESLGTAGNLVTDAQIAAIAIDHGAVVHTSDADFTRFPKLHWINPISGVRSRSSRRRV
jgi:predicted nucleic acid-binding protein